MATSNGIGILTPHRTINPDNLGKLPLAVVCNALEGFATFFISGVADEYIAYHTVGTTFLGTMDKIIPWVAACKDNGYYRNLFHLYVLWKRRKEKQLLCQKREALEEQISKISTSKSYPVGVD